MSHMKTLVHYRNVFFFLMFVGLRHFLCCDSRVGGQSQGGYQVPPQVQMAVGRAVTNAAVNELSNAFRFHK